VIGERAWERAEKLFEQLYEKRRKKKPVWRGCDYCWRSMWRGYPKDQGPTFMFEENGPYPLVCELNTPDNLDQMLSDLSAQSLPPLHQLRHALHQTFGIPCSEKCQPPVIPRKFTGSELGMTKIERVKAAYRIEDVAGSLTSLKGGRVLKGCGLCG
jgi:hypothetical protein